MDQDLGEIYRRMEGRISQEDFLSRVDEKVSLMGGLCDPHTAALLVARELGVGDVQVKIRDIRPESGMVGFVGRVVSSSQVREFRRSDGSSGKVASLILGDETGIVRVVLWDEGAELVRSGDLHADQVLQVRGFAREGRDGTEVSIGRGCTLQEVDQDIRVRVEPFKIGEISADQSDLNIVARVIEVGEVRQFQRKDGTAGRLRSIVLGDETGKIRMTLWDQAVDMDIAEGQVLEVINASSRERYGQVEVQTGRYTVIRQSAAEVEYQESLVPIRDLEVGAVCSISGFVSGIGEVREFQRGDGAVGRVANIHVSDATGRVKVALWGDLVELLNGVDLGFRAEIHDCQIKSGWNDELEASCGWRSRITFAPPE
ncbi:MAG: Replication factor A [Methanosaeta sp. PtaB.Bin039]|nr:MAG: Replication factor A [Methanosaeta sp. PtaB.Bin039]HOT06167.1 OB-fold nucleic acid binding domain-containing protein [Methanotrichaceae archaeon]HQF15524.1 OB-fold nucleic acid binding domain-containing protein [Methanotrichaceae archaeon]HQI90259.1 OB-fold nucleic acid binding domain-containing protein [Methanotrichaceae archaeon]HQJ27772.1 OB-fold nucleic acid binding domain-containing protein [Methanotrichaceae archaeon]